ncbi:Signal recognition particle receptor subunit beta, partial [Linum grandiflorum]
LQRTSQIITLQSSLSVQNAHPSPIHRRPRRSRALYLISPRRGLCRCVFEMEGIEQWKSEVNQWIQQGIDYVTQVPAIQQGIQYVSQAPQIQQGIEFIRQLPPLQLCITVFLLLFPIIVLILAPLFKRQKPNTIVLSGLSGSGKTVLFYQLRDGSSHQGAVTSMEPNEGTFSLHSEAGKELKVRPVHVVDVPGHPRLWPKLDEFLPKAAGIVFVVDALEFLPNVHAVSEYLYDILTKASVVSKKVPVLICCNKTEKVTAHSKEFIFKQLEKEIDKLRQSRSSVSDADVANDHTLGVSGKPFSFSQCTNKVSVGEASGLTGKIADVEQFIRENVGVPYIGY